MNSHVGNPDYAAFLESKAALPGGSGFEPIEVPGYIFPFKRHLTEWAIRRGRASIMAGCGLGKTPMQLTWADNVVRHVNRPVLVLTPLAVGSQTVREAVKFGFDAEQSRDGKFARPIVVTNYEKLHLFRPVDFGGVVLDEAQILKDFKGKTRAAITEFMRTIPHRLLCTATPAPNDYIELGTSAEALGEMGFSDMITRFFKQDDQKPFRVHAWGRVRYRMRAHGERDFWRWVCSWARACRKPSDIGFSDEGYELPPIVVREHEVIARTTRPGMLFDMPAATLPEQRDERRRTIRERCEKVAELVSHDRPSVAWCHLNDEGDLLRELIPDSVQVSGSDADEAKEEAFEAFVRGDVRVMVTKPVIGALGLNWEHCAHQTFFPSHSYEQWHQGVHRSQRFGQKHQVEVDVVTTEGEAGVLANLRRKSEQADRMFERLVELMHEHLQINRSNPFHTREEAPPWLCSIN